MLPAHRERYPTGLRRFAGISIAAVTIFLPLDVSTRPAEALGPLLLVYAIYVLPPLSVLAMTTVLWTPRRLARLAPFLVLVQLLACNAYLAISPDRSGLVASALTCLLVGSGIVFGWPPWRVLGIAGVACAAFAVAGIIAHLPTVPFEVALGSVMVGATLAVACAAVLADFRRQLAIREDELRTLSRRLMSAQEEERRRLSRELHDELGQSLTAVGAYLWLAERDVPGDKPDARDRLGEARRLVAKTLSQMRELSQLLCPPVLALQGLVPSLEAQVEAFQKRHTIKGRFTASGVSGRLPTEVETALYRITQEALTNVARHAQARSVRVSLVADELELRLDVEDDGIGMSDQKGGAVSGSGLLGISERARALGGTVHVSSRRGTHLCVRVPRQAVLEADPAVRERRARSAHQRSAATVSSALATSAP